MALLVLLAVVAGSIVGGICHLASAAAQRRSPRESSGALEQLVADHLRMGRDRMSAAEARIALLEERLAFHDGFLRVSPLPGADRTEPLLAIVERVARARSGRVPGARDAAQDAAPRDRDAASSAPRPETAVLRFPDPAS